MLPLSLFRSRNFSGANLVTLMLYGALSGGLFFVPYNLVQKCRAIRARPPAPPCCRS